VHVGMVPRPVRDVPPDWSPGEDLRPGDGLAREWRAGHRFQVEKQPEGSEAAVR
jgi:hypothetical protein